MAEKEEKLTPSLILKMFAETDKKFEKSHLEWQEIKESQKATDKQIKELSKQIGGISNSNGKVAEDMIYNVLDKDKTFANVKFDYLRKNVQIQSETYETKTELDILLVNGDTISIIETKYKVEKSDVIDVIDKKLNYFRQYNPKFNNYKIILGIGGMSFEDDAITAAKEKGIGIIKILGDKLEYYTDGIKIY